MEKRVGREEGGRRKLQARRIYLPSKLKWILYIYIYIMRVCVHVDSISLHLLSSQSCALSPRAIVTRRYSQWSGKLS